MLSEVLYYIRRRTCILNNHFLPPRVRTVNYGTETINYRGQHFWVTLPQQKRNTQSINEFKNHITNLIGADCTYRYAGYLCCSWGSCDSIFFVARGAISHIHYCVWCGCLDCGESRRRSPNCGAICLDTIF